MSTHSIEHREFILVARTKTDDGADVAGLLGRVGMTPEPREVIVPIRCLARNKEIERFVGQHRKPLLLAYPNIEEAETDFKNKVNEAWQRHAEERHMDLALVEWQGIPPAERLWDDG